MATLSDPIESGRVNLKNRLMMAPVATELSDRGKVTDELLEYYDERTRGGSFGLVVTEHSFVHPDGRASRNQLSSSSDSDIEGLTKLAGLIHSNGSKAILQISHAGSATRREITGTAAISPGMKVNPFGMMGNPEDFFPVPRIMKKGDFDVVVKSFVEAAMRAKQAGFDGVELHSAHGYLLNEFYSPITNDRMDEYSGRTIDGRLRLHMQLIKLIRKLVGEDFIISMRFGGCDYHKDGSTIEDACEGAVRLETAGLDLLDMSGGMCFFWREGHAEAGYFSDMTEAVKKSVKIPVVLTGGVSEKEEAEWLLSKGKGDIIGVGRVVLKNPDWARKIMGTDRDREA